jgi:hypothetical protein
MRFSTRNHRLPVVTGRWQGIPSSERKCSFCNDDVGDEFHYFFTWQKFFEERKKSI